MRENGRSMVEMLGVLAIIGVLSVGAIAGYSKAMMKYKLNKQIGQINTLLNAALSYKDSLCFGEISQQQALLPYFSKLNLIPPEMFMSANVYGHDRYLYDVFKNQIFPCLYPNLKIGAIAIKLISRNTPKTDICLNLLNIAKEYSSNLLDIQINNGIYYSVYGDDFCSKQNNKPCLKNLTISQMQKYCMLLEDFEETNMTSWQFYFRWKSC